jgi:kynureninase
MDHQLSAQFASELDKSDKLSELRSQFNIPITKDGPCIYFNGNSLGCQPVGVHSVIGEELDIWAKMGVEGHFEAPKRPWAQYHKLSKKGLSHLTGALIEEVVAMNNLTTNLHLMMVSFYRPQPLKYKIMVEKGAFPSDYYAVESQLKFHGYPLEGMIELSPEPGEHFLKTDRILDKIDMHREELALILLSGVQYYSGQLFDLERISEKAQEHNIIIGFDLAHAIGNVPLKLHDWNIDFAVWCSYKYLNAGPGSVGGAFIHEKHFKNQDIKRFAGWWGHNEKERFKMKKGFLPMYGADGWQLSNVNILSSASRLASLDILLGADIDKLRSKSISLTSYLEFCLNSLSNQFQAFEIITPSNSGERGCQLSIRVNKDGEAMFRYLNDKGVVTDWREPNVIRMAPVPLYNTFTEVFEVYKILNEFLSKKIQFCLSRIRALFINFDVNSGFFHVQCCHRSDDSGPPDANSIGFFLSVSP